MKKIVYAAILALAVGSACAADISISKNSADSPGPVVIKGPIESGDYGRLLYLLVTEGSNNDGQWIREGRQIFITSPGGSIEEATKIATLIRESYFRVTVFRECHSACFLIYAAGVSRLPLGPIGLHNPYYAKEYA